MAQWIAWTIAGIVLIIAEMATLTFYLLWLGVGAFAAAGTAYFTENIFVQILAGCFVALILTIFTHPLTRNVRHSAIGFYDPYEGIVGKTGKVEEAIEPHQMGQVRVGSEVWTAVADEHINAGQDVTVIERNSTILKVETLGEK